MPAWTSTGVNAPFDYIIACCNCRSVDIVVLPIPSEVIGFLHMSCIIQI